MTLLEQPTTTVGAFPLTEFKAEDASGLFAARVSAFGNVDLNGDRVIAGAFKRTIANWRAKGDPVPVIESHAHDDLGKVIGEAHAENMKETKDSFVVAGRMFLRESDPNHDRAREVFDLMKRKLITAWSYAFTVPEGGERIAKDGVREITDLDLIEVGPTLLGANPEARTIALKAALTEIKAGRRHSDATLRVLTRMRQELDDLLADESDETEASDAPMSEAERLRLSLSEIDAFLSERGRQ